MTIDPINMTGNMFLAISGAEVLAGALLICFLAFIIIRGRAGLFELGLAIIAPAVLFLAEPEINIFGKLIQVSAYMALAFILVWALYAGFRE